MSKPQYLPYFFLAFTLMALAPAQAQSHILGFSSNAGLNGPAIRDGQGGSTQIPDLSIEIFLIDGPDLEIFQQIKYKSQYQLMTTDGFGGLTTFDQDGSGWRGHALRETDGKTFILISFDWLDYGLANAKAMTVVGLRKGSPIAAFDFQGNREFKSVKVRLPADFPATDEIRIITRHQEESTYPVINNIELEEREKER
jgi:hypothetical protein